MGNRVERHELENPMRKCAPHCRTAATGQTMAGILALALGFSAVAMAGDPATPEPPATVTPCDSPQIHQFDFWVGDWLVYDADHDNQLVGLDRVERHSHGCIIQENLTLITDLYRRPGVGYRLAGIGVNRFDGERWLQLWADNQWGAITMSGSLEANGSMVFRSLIPSRQRDLKIVYEKHADGTVRTLQYVAPAGSGKWEKYGDLLYRPNR
jgi:hypothetical protein